MCPRICTALAREQRLFVALARGQSAVGICWLLDATGICWYRHRLYLSYSLSSHHTDSELETSDHPQCLLRALLVRRVTFWLRKDYSEAIYWYQKAGKASHKTWTMMDLPKQGVEGGRRSTRALWGGRWVTYWEVPGYG